jgi:hypothetical protein
VTPFIRQKLAATTPQAVPMLPSHIGPPTFVIMRFAGTCMLASAQAGGHSSNISRARCQCQKRRTAWLISRLHVPLHIALGNVAGAAAAAAAVQSTLK